MSKPVLRYTHSRYFSGTFSWPSPVYSAPVDGDAAVSRMPAKTNTKAREIIIRANRVLLCIRSSYSYLRASIGFSLAALIAAAIQSRSQQNSKSLWPTTGLQNRWRDECRLRLHFPEKRSTG